MASHTRTQVTSVPFARRLVRLFRTVLPNKAKAVELNERGVCLAERGDVPEAKALFENALDADPRCSEAYWNLATCYYADADYDLACHTFSAAEELGRIPAELYDNWGNALAKLGRLTDAVAKHRAAISLSPDFVGAQANLAVILSSMGRADEAAELAADAWAREPENRNFASMALHLSLYSEIFSVSELAAGHSRWPGMEKPRVETNSRDVRSDRKLKVGYVSSDFRLHSCACFLIPLLRAHDSEAVELYAYSVSSKDDEVTDYVKQIVNHWRPSSTLSDQSLVKQIEEDAIDILVDCNGHTAGNRLSVFLSAPAPVQVTWLGYPFSTGLKAVGARITDEVADPVGESEAYHSERVLRLPGGYHTYMPLVATPKPAGVLATDGHKGPRFGVFHKLSKFSPHAMALWASVAKATPDGKLVLKAFGLKDSGVMADVIERFAALGIRGDQLDVLPWGDRYGAHFEDFNSLDVMLDAVPYNGTTTTCEALWMGVPVVTRTGDRPSARAGASLLSQIGRQEWIAHSDADYVRIATELASSVEVLDQIRVSLRDEVLESTLGNASLFAREMESAYRTLWRDALQGEDTR